MNHRKDGDTKKVYDLILEGQTPTMIARLLHLSRPSVYYHLAKLCHANALACELGHYSPGPAPFVFKPDTPPEGVAPKPDTLGFEPGFRRVNGWQFSARINPPCILPKSNTIGHHAASFKKRYRLSESMWATIQAQGREDNGHVLAKTALVTIDEFDIRPDELLRLEETTYKAAIAAVVKFEKDTGARIGLVELAKLGEVCKPDPRLAGAGKIDISPTCQVNQSPPGPAVEFKGNRKGLMAAIAEYTLADRIDQLERGIYTYFEGNGRTLETLTANLATLVDMQKRQVEQNAAILDALNQMTNPPPRETVGRIGGYL